MTTTKTYTTWFEAVDDLEHGLMTTDEFCDMPNIEALYRQWIVDPGGWPDLCCEFQSTAHEGEEYDMADPMDLISWFEFYTH